MARRYDVVVLGELNVDLIVTGTAEPEWGQHEKIVDDAQLVAGSSSAIFACGAARLGLRTAFVGVIGDDAFGSFMREHLNQAGVDTQHLIVDPTLRTGMTIILLRPDGDRAILTYLGSIAALRTEQIDPGLLADARYVHAGSYFLQHALQPGLPALFARARTMGTLTSLDTNWDPDEQWESGLQQVLRETDIFLPNAAEATAIAKATDQGEALEILAKQVPLVAIKCGAAGAIATNRKTVAHAHPPSLQTVDTTGAGDSFDAGMIAALAHGLELQEALDIAVACGSLSTRGIGGTSAQATWQEARKAARID